MKRASERRARDPTTRDRGVAGDRPAIPAGRLHYVMGKSK
jgi:hypothetical protein